MAIAADVCADPLHQRVELAECSGVDGATRSRTAAVPQHADREDDQDGIDTERLPHGFLTARATDRWLQGVIWIQVWFYKIKFHLRCDDGLPALFLVKIKNPTQYVAWRYRHR